jgi:hypothetical protein
MKVLMLASRVVLGAVFSFGLGACSSSAIHQDIQSMAAPIEIIDSNFVESPYDNEIVLIESPFQTFGA